MREPSTRARPRVAVELLEDVLAQDEPTFEPQPREGVDVRGEDRRRGPRARLSTTPSRRCASCARSRRTSAPARSWTGAVTSGGRASRTAARAARGAARRQAPHDVRRVPARPAMTAARAPGGVRGRAARLRGRRVRRPRAAQREPRGSTRATARSRSGSPTEPCSASGRSTTRSRRSAGVPCASSIRRSALRCASARTSSATSSVAPHAAVNEIGRARARGAAGARGRRSRTRSCAGSPRESSALLAGLPEGPLKHSYPDWVSESGARDFGEEDALALMRAQNEPPETVVRLVRGEVDGEPTDVPGALRVDRVDEEALAPGASGRRAAAPSSPALAVGSPRRRARRSTSAPPRAARRRCSRGEVVAVELQRGRARELEENAAGSAPTTSPSSTPTRRRCRPS